MSKADCPCGTPLMCGSSVPLHCSMCGKEGCETCLWKTDEGLLLCGKCENMNKSASKTWTDWWILIALFLIGCATWVTGFCIGQALGRK